MTDLMMMFLLLLAASFAFVVLAIAALVAEVVDAWVEGRRYEQ